MPMIPRVRERFDTIYWGLPIERPESRHPDRQVLVRRVGLYTSLADRATTEIVWSGSRVLLGPAPVEVFAAELPAELDPRHHFEWLGTPVDRSPPLAGGWQIFPQASSVRALIEMTPEAQAALEADPAAIVRIVLQVVEERSVL